MEPSTFQEGSGCQRRTVVSCRSVHSSLGKAGQQQTDCRRLQRRKTPRTRSSKAYRNNVGLRLLMEVDSLYSAGCRLDVERRKKTGLESCGGRPRRECILEQDSRRKGSYWILAMIRPYLHRTRNSGLGTVWCNCQSMG